MADNFIENILDAGCKIAKHKKSEVLTATDLKIAIGNIIFISQRKITKFLSQTQLIQYLQNLNQTKLKIFPQQTTKRE